MCGPMQSSLTKSKPTPYGRRSYSYVFIWAPDAVSQLRRRNGREGGRRAGHDALSAMGDTGRLVGMGGLNTILDTMASRHINCCIERGKDGEMALASALFPARRDGPEDAASDVRLAIAMPTWSSKRNILRPAYRWGARRTVGMWQRHASERTRKSTLRAFLQ